MSAGAAPLVCREHGVVAPAAAPEALRAHPEVWCPACARRAGARPRVVSMWHSDDGRSEGFLIDFGATRFERTWRLVRDGQAPDGSADVVDVTWHADASSSPTPPSSPCSTPPSRSTSAPKTPSRAPRRSWGRDTGWGRV
jgi:hypothetical protein